MQNKDQKCLEPSLFHLVQFYSPPALTARMPKDITVNASAPRNVERYAPYKESKSLTKAHACIHPGCGKTFPSKANLARHKWLHIPEDLLPLCPYEGDMGWRCTDPKDRYRGRSQQMKDHWLRDHSHRGPYPMGYKFPSLQEVCDANNIDKEDVLPFDSPLKLRTRSETVLHKYIIGKMMPHFHGSLSGLNKTLKKSRPKTPKTETTPEESRGATPIAESLMGCGQIGWEIPQPLFASLESTTVAPLTLEHLEWPFQVPPISSSTLPPFPNNTRDFGLGVDPVEYYNTKPFYAPQPSSVDFDILFNIQPNSNGLPFSPIIDEDWGWLASVSQPKA